MTFTGMSFWGNTADIKVPSSVRLTGEDDPLNAIRSWIARHNKPLQVVNCRADSRAVDRDGNVTARSYELTIGEPEKWTTGKRPIAQRYAVAGRVWCSIEEESDR
jgi:hypothetical protein